MIRVCTELSKFIHKRNGKFMYKVDFIMVIFFGFVYFWLPVRCGYPSDELSIIIGQVAVIAIAAHQGRINGGWLSETRWICGVTRGASCLLSPAEETRAGPFTRVLATCRLAFYNEDIVSLLFSFFFPL